MGPGRVKTRVTGRQFMNFSRVSAVSAITGSAEGKNSLQMRRLQAISEFSHSLGRVSRTRLRRTVRNCTRDEGGPFEAGSQVQVSSHRKLLSSRAMVASVAETSGHDPGRHD